jgi:sugar phosphate isomerase/epimerase
MAIPVGVQLYSVRQEAAADLPAVLARVKAMGYDGVEFAGYYEHQAPALRRMLDTAGLVCCGTHTGMNALLGDELERTVEFHQTIGATRPIVPGMPAEYTANAAAWKRTAGVFNQIASRLEPYGMQTGYHNHHTEFTPTDSGELPWDIFFGNTVDAVIMQFDTGNAWLGGGQALPFLRKYPGRARSVHLKPFSPSLATAAAPHAGFRPAIGEDQTPWPELLRTCESVGGAEWYVIEYESDKYPPMEAIDICLRNLRRIMAAGQWG